MKIRKIVPSYGFVILIFVVALNMITYCGTRLLVSDWKHYSMATPLDENIPLCTGFVVFYILAYVQWIVGFVLIARQEKTFCCQYLFGEMIAKMLCLVCFVIYPTFIVRPQIVGNGIFDQLTAFIYAVDAPDNLFPSIHCLESYVCLRTAFKIKSLPRGYHIYNVIMTIGVFASTVFLKQHVIADMIGAVVVVEIGFAITNLVYKREHVIKKVLLMGRVKNE